MLCRSAPRSRRRAVRLPRPDSLFEGAIRAYRELGMSLFAAAAQRSLGSLLGGDEGRALVAAADQWMTSQGIRNPARMASLYIGPAPDRE